jgi:hypothetical protein
MALMFFQTPMYNFRHEHSGTEKRVFGIGFSTQWLTPNTQYQYFMATTQEDLDIQAAELMGKLHDRLKEIGYEGHPLEVYLVRVLFCLFAEDTGIFGKQQFQDYIEQRTNVDGSNLAEKIQSLFQVLNTSKEKRFNNLDEQLNDYFSHQL